MNVLYITEISPFPINGGERIRAYGLLKAFNNIANNMIAIIGNTDHVDLQTYSQKYDFNKTTFIPFNEEYTSWNSKVTKYFKKNPKLMDLIHNIDLKTINLVILDYNFKGQYIDFFKDHNISVIYGTHNSQSNLTLQLETINHTQYIKKIFSYFLQVFHEYHYFNKADKLLVVSSEDAKFHSKFIEHSNIIIIPNFLDEDLYQTYSNNKKNYIVMTANFNAFQNHYGLQWFLENIWDADLSKKIKLLLVGKGSDTVLNKLNYVNDNSIEEIGMVDDITTYISKAKLSIIPLLHGSGTRLKCLESMALKTLIVGTEIGVEGIVHHNSILTSNEPKEFKKLLLDVINNNLDIEKHTNNAYQTFIDYYSLSCVQQQLHSLVTSIHMKNKNV